MENNVGEGIRSIGTLERSFFVSTPFKNYSDQKRNRNGMWLHAPEGRTILSSDREKKFSDVVKEQNIWRRRFNHEHCELYWELHVLRDIQDKLI